MKKMENSGQATTNNFMCSVDLVSLFEHKRS